MEQHASFAPVVSRQTRGQTRVLILGSLPGAASLAAQAYYAHPRNHFWTIIGAVLDEDRFEDPFSERPYAQRLRILKKHRIGLWDVVARAERQGSLDQNLKNITPNPLADLIDTLPALRLIAFNGQTAAHIGMRQLKKAGITLPYFVLPSTSPANTMPLAAKIAAWQVIIFE